MPEAVLSLASLYCTEIPLDHHWFLTIEFWIDGWEEFTIACVLTAPGGEQAWFGNNFCTTFALLRELSECHQRARHAGFSPPPIESLLDALPDSYIETEVARLNAPQSIDGHRV